MIKFGMWSTVLGLGSLHGLCMAGLLLAHARGRSAPRFLAALLLAVVLMITPYTIGYAGFYDAYPWLTFAPFYWQLAFGPLMYFSVRQLSAAQLPRAWLWHFVPALLQGGYYCALFALPLDSKWAWNERVHLPFVLPALSIVACVSLAVYWMLAWRRHRAYQRWLTHNSGMREELRLNWASGFLYSIAAVTLIAVGFLLVDAWVRPLSYFSMFPFYVAVTLLVYYLGLEAWRHVRQRYPTMPEGEAEPSAVDDVANTAPARDWAEQARTWAERVREAGWWREPELGLSDLARRLGTNTNYLSRALNEGLGQSFSEFVNRLRIAEARRLLKAPGEVLDIALAVGFGSKASFNRAFRTYVGQTPSAYRAGQHGANRENSTA